MGWLRLPRRIARQRGPLDATVRPGWCDAESRPDYQDMWPANPEPSESAKAKGEENDKVDKGEVSPINPDGVDRPTQTKATHKEEKK